MLILGGVSFVCFFVTNLALQITSETQSLRIRKLYLKSALSQNMGWYDGKKVGEITERFGGDVEKVERGIGMQFAQIFTALTSFFGGWIAGFVRGWRLALVVLSVMPVLIITVAVMSLLMHKYTTKIQGILAQAGGIAEEVILSVRTVTSLNCQEYSAERYERHLGEAYKIGVKRAVLLAVSFGMIFFVMFGAFTLSFWYGAYLVRKGIMNAGLVMSVFMAVLMGAMAIGTIAPSTQAVGEARGCAYELFSLIDRPSEIDPFSTAGKTISVKGDIAFSNVKFVYPTRPTAQVLKGVSFTVDQGKTIALVGPSGCGKSTTVGLLERFYDKASGKITIDGVPLEHINISCLREQIGIVGQEPVLFATTIMDNIRLGSKDDVSEEKVYEAAKMANIYDYIMNLPKQFDTMVGERGVQLSGGQKQRIAIARALVKNPRILILDEATSALDTESEGIVQQALENASKGRTTMVIAHRLSTVRNADEIIVLENGLIKEKGTHDELIKLKGLYFALVNKQLIKRSKNEKTSNLLEKKAKTSKKQIKNSKVSKSSPKKKVITIEDENLLPGEIEDENSSTSSSFSPSSSSIELSS
jgi:ABC-type multidrug transport system fused ATPase/permease subunit